MKKINNHMNMKQSGPHQKESITDKIKKIQQEVSKSSLKKKPTKEKKKYGNHRMRKDRTRESKEAEEILQMIGKEVKRSDILIKNHKKRGTSQRPFSKATRKKKQASVNPRKKFERLVLKSKKSPERQTVKVKKKKTKKIEAKEFATEVEKKRDESKNVSRENIQGKLLSKFSHTASNWHYNPKNKGSQMKAEVKARNDSAVAKKNTKSKKTLKTKKSQKSKNIKNKRLSMAPGFKFSSQLNLNDKKIRAKEDILNHKSKISLDLMSANILSHKFIKISDRVPEEEKTDLKNMNKKIFEELQITNEIDVKIAKPELEIKKHSIPTILEGSLRDILDTSKRKDLLSRDESRSSLQKFKRNAPIVRKTNNPFILPLNEILNKNSEREYSTQNQLMKDKVNIYSQTPISENSEDVYFPQADRFSPGFSTVKTHDNSINDKALPILEKSLRRLKKIEKQKAGYVSRDSSLSRLQKKNHNSKNSEQLNEVIPENYIEGSRDSMRNKLGYSWTEQSSRVSSNIQNSSLQENLRKSRIIEKMNVMKYLEENFENLKGDLSLLIQHKEKTEREKTLDKKPRNEDLTDRELIISFEMNDVNSLDSFTNKIDNKKKLGRDSSEEKMSVNKDKDNILESKTFKVITRSGINKLANGISSHHRSESHSMTSAKDKSKGKKKSKNEQSKRNLNPRKAKEKNNNSRLSKAAQSQKIVEKRKRKFSRVKKKGIKDKRKSEFNLSSNPSGSQIKASQNIKFFKPEFGNKKKTKQSQSKANLIKNSSVADLENNNLSDFLLTKSSMNSILNKKGLNRKKSGVIKSSFFGKGKTKKTQKKKDLNSSLKFPNSKKVKVQNSNPQLIESKQMKKTLFTAKSKKNDKLSSRASLAHDKVIKLKKKAPTERTKKQSLFIPINSSISLEKNKFMNTTDAYAKKKNYDLEGKVSSTGSKIGSFTNFNTEIKIRKNKYGNIKRDIALSSMDKIPKSKKLQKSLRDPKSEKHKKAQPMLTVSEIKQISQKQRDLSYRNKLKTISNIKKTGSSFKESFSKKYYQKQSENRSNQPSQRKLTISSLDKNIPKENPKRSNRLIDYTGKANFSSKNIKLEQDNITSVKKISDEFDPEPQRKSKKKEKNLFSFSENNLNLVKNFKKFKEKEEERSRKEAKGKQMRGSPDVNKKKTSRTPQ